MIRIFLLTIIFDFVLYAHGQHKPSTRYTTAEGLVADRITRIVQDDKGFMWFGTYFGISRYDGDHFSTIPLPATQQNKYVSAMVVAEGKVYAGFYFEGGLMEYSNGIAKAHVLPVRNKQNLNDVTALCPHNREGILVAGAGNNVYHYTNGKFRFLFELDSAFNQAGIGTMAMDRHGNVWAGTIKGLVVYTTNKKLIRLSEKNTIYLKDSKNGMLSVSGRGNNYEFVKHNNSPDSFTVADTIWKSTAIAPVFQDNYDSNAIWMTDTAGRFLQITPAGSTSSYATENVSKNDIHFLYADRENNLWIATHTGVIKMANLPALSFAFTQKAFGAADITGKDSMLWTTNSQSLFTMQGGQLQQIPEFRSAGNKDYFGRIYYDGDYLWVSGWHGGVWKVKIRGSAVVSQQFYNRFGNTMVKMHTMATDGKGNFWMGGENGLFYIRNGKILHHYQPVVSDGSRMFIVTMMVDPANAAIWIGENGNGIYKINYSLEESGITYAIAATIHRKEGLTDGNIRSLLLDSRNTIWAGTRFGGVFRIHESDGKYEVKNLTTEADLACSRVTDIKEDADHNLWIATCSGVYRYRRDQDDWHAFTTSNGLMDAEVYAHYISSETKRVWAVSPSGITALQYETTALLPAPLINITRITVLGKNDTAAMFNNRMFTYKADESSIGFQFAGASYTDEKKVLYKFMLQGHDNTWSAPTHTNNVNYVSLPPGDYVFRVMASSGNGGWSEEPATFSFTITRPFYQSPWFVVVLLCLAFAAFYFFRMYRLNERLKLERIRSRISSDLHDDIGSTLSSISIISEGAIAEKNPEASKQMIREISENTQFLLDKMDDIIWCVNPRNDSFHELLMRIKKFASTLFEARGIDYDIVIEEGISDAALPMNYRQHIYLILKEAINNLVKYSGATFAGIAIRQKGSHLEITVTDNGKGFDTDSLEDGNGLRNMKRRAAEMDAQLVINTGSGGTRIFLDTKIK